MSEQLGAQLRLLTVASESLPGDFTGSIMSPVSTNKRGKPVRHVREYIAGACICGYEVRIRRPER